MAGGEQEVLWQEYGTEEGRTKLISMVRDYKKHAGLHAAEMVSADTSFYGKSESMRNTGTNTWARIHAIMQPLHHPPHK